MKRFKHLFIAFICFIGQINAQSISGKINGDAGNPLAYVTIEILASKDSIHIAGTTSAPNGNYKFDNVASGSYIVKASYVGYTSAQKRVMLFNGRHLNVDFILQEEATSLDEITIVASGVTVKGDTTTYYTSSYRTGKERNLKDVLEVLPGVKVDANTNVITVKGKSIRKILIENQDIFQGSTSVPMENLSADGIKSVDVIDNYSEYNIFDGFRTTDETVINLNVSEDMKGKLSGDTELYGGVKKKYQIKNSSIRIGKKAMLSGIVSANNTGHSPLKSADIIGMNGGFNELLSNENPSENIERTLKSYSSFIDLRKNVHQRDNGIVSLNMALNPSPRVKVLWNAMAGLDSYRLKSADRYSFVNGLEYTDNTTEKQNKQHYLTNLKLSYMPNKTINIFYKSKFYLAQREQDITNGIDNELFNGLTQNNNWTTENNILAVKAFGTNTLNVVFDINYSRYNRDYHFKSDSTSIYEDIYPLSDRYAYLSKQAEGKYSAQIFYLHRLSDKYFARVGLQSSYNTNSLCGTLRQACPDSVFNNDNRMNYWDNNANIRFSKDSGKFTFTVGISLRHIQIHSNLKRNVLEGNNLVVSPNTNLTYRFNPMHFISFAYDEYQKWNAMNDLMDNHFIQSYNQIVYSSVNRYYGYARKASLTHMLMMPLQGITMTHIASFEHLKNDVVNDFHSKGIVNEVNREVSLSGINQISIMSSLEKRFMFMPLNIKVNFAYLYNDAPLAYNHNFIDSRFNTFNIQGIASTHYKRGFNGKLVSDIAITKQRNDISCNKLFSIDYLALVSYHTDKLYASFDARYRDYQVNDNHSHHLYFDFELRYNLNPQLSLHCIGNDFLNLNGRVQREAKINDYYTNNRAVHYMPGYIIGGITFKY